MDLQVNSTEINAMPVQFKKDVQKWAEKVLKK